MCSMTDANKIFETLIISLNNLICKFKFKAYQTSWKIEQWKNNEEKIIITYSKYLKILQIKTFNVICKFY